MRMSSFAAIMAVYLHPTLALPASTSVGHLLSSRKMPGENSVLNVRGAPDLYSRPKAARVKGSKAKTGNAKAGNATAPAEGGAAKEEEDDKAGQIEVAGVFGTPNAVGASVFTNLNFPANAAGSLEVEYNGTAANNIFVVPKVPTATPPAGHLFVDPMTFTIQTQVTTSATDKLKVDYIFTEAVKAIIDPAQVVPGKLDAATNTFVTQGLGEFEFEEEENEWSLTVSDLNGEFAMFVPEVAVKAAT